MKQGASSIKIEPISCSFCEGSTTATVHSEYRAQRAATATVHSEYRAQRAAGVIGFGLLLVVPQKIRGIMSAIGVNEIAVLPESARVLDE
jgi:hypothetical protein